MAYIGVQPAAGQYRKLDDISAGFNGTSTTFTTSVSGENVTAGTAQQLLVSVGGVIQEPKTDYDVSTNSIVFTTAPAAGLDFFAVLMGDAVNTITVPDGSVTTAKLAGSLSVGLAGGTNSAPTLFFTGDTNTGVYSPGADQVAVTTGGTQRLLIDASGNVNLDSNTLYVDAANNRVGVGTSSPSGALDVRGELYAGNGTITNFLSYSTGNSTGIVGTSSNHSLEFRTNNTERMRLTSTGLGIGTSSPSTLLHVAGSGSETTTTQTPVSIYATTSSTAANGFGPTLEFGAEASDGSNYAQTTIRSLWTDATAATRSSALTFSTRTGAGAVTERLRIDDQGRVGIGSTSPQNLFVISNGGANGLEFNPTTESGTANYVISYNRTAAAYRDLRFDAAATRFEIGGNEAARIDSSRRLLVGTSSSSDSTAMVLAGYNGGGANLPAVLWMKRTENASTITADESLGLIRFGSLDSGFGASIDTYADGTWSSTSDCPARLVFSTTADGSSSPTERARISSNGTANFYSQDDVIYARSNRAAGGIYATFVGVRDATSTTNGTISFLVYTNGNVQNTNGSYTAISDAKLKENIIDASSQWDDLKAIQIRNWNFKAETGHETHRQIGPIAQELETVCPGLVFETPDRDADGNETGEVTKGINQSVLYMKAVKALQEAMERIEQLEAKVAALESA